jgi:NADH:ubiquinone oxidoreductase subunit 5 (subunit L)/multisubunit Na+/H+ antiporter MnhA subunit
MHKTISKHLIFTVAAIPIGAASGFICAAIIFSTCQLLWMLFGIQGSDLTWDQVLAVAVYFGAFLGAILLPLSYLCFLRHVKESEVGKVIIWLFCVVLSAGILSSPLGAFFSLIVTLIGFMIGVYGARRRTSNI